MTEFQSVIVALFGIALGIFALSSFFFIRVLSKIVDKISSNTADTEIAAVSNAVSNTISNAVLPEDAIVYDSPAGEVELIDVDDDTAAMIMAIVSHESQIPVSELVFKSIKAV